MITTAVQVQQVSQMVEIQGAPQPAQSGSGEDFGSTFAANVASASTSASSGTPNGQSSSQPAVSALRSALADNASGNAKGSSSSTVSKSVGVLAKPFLIAGTTSTLVGLAAIKSSDPNSGSAVPETLSPEGAPTNAALSAVADALVDDATVAASAPGDDSGSVSNAAANLKSGSPALDAAGQLAPVSDMRKALLTPETSRLTPTQSGSVAKTAQTDRKPEGIASRTAATSNATGVQSQTIAAQTNIQANLNAALVFPTAAQPPTSAPFDLVTTQKPDAARTPTHGGMESNIKLSALAEGGVAANTAGAMTAISSLSLGDASDAAAAAAAGDAAGLAAQGAASGPGVSAVGGASINAGAVAARVNANNGHYAPVPLPGGTGVDALTKTFGAQAQSTLVEASADATSLQQTSTTQAKVVPVSAKDFVAKPVEQASSRTLTTVPTAKTQAAASAPSGISTKVNEVPGAAAAPAQTQPKPDENPQQSGDSFASVTMPEIATQPPVVSRPVQLADASREAIAASVSAAKDAKTKASDNASVAVGVASSDLGQGTVTGLSTASGTDPSATAKDASAISPAVPAPALHGAAEPVASIGMHGVVALAATPNASSDRTGSVGVMGGTTSAQSSVTAATGGLGTGLGNGLGTAPGTDAAASHRTLLATPTSLEVGVPNGTQGWLRIRAEVGGQGEVNASLAAGSSGAQEMLHSQLPALNAYLHSEQMPVIATVAERSFSFAGGSHPGSGNHPGGSGDGSGSGSSLPQGGAPQSDGGDRQTAQPSFIPSASVREYGALAGRSDPGIAAAASPLGAASAIVAENGQWLNIRV